ncbi:ABC transporter permease [Haladaptatus salinisoli]|uniref:ABC transporter permease n=1 Tax=Haladaptatus salinisoli TaxID=2884876 RepID=UPI001D0BC9E3|nr:ABC transporter permease [Haladaptatus salinisoli]
MGYKKVLLTQWTRRDWLTVLIIAVTAAFLVGTTLLLSAAGAQSAALAGNYDNSMVVEHSDSYTKAQQTAANSDLVFPTTTVIRNGEKQYIVGVPANAPTELTQLSVSWRKASIPRPPANGLRGTVSTPTQQQLQTNDGRTLSVPVVPYTSTDSIFPHSWYVANPSTVQSLGDTDALIIRTNVSNSSGWKLLPQQGTVSPSLFAYFLGGMQEVLRVLFAATAGAAVLILVVLYNVTKMSVRSRLKTIEVIRSTGGTSRRIIGIFAIRAGTLALVGSLLGYALGVIVTRATVNIAIFLGLSISLEPAVTPSVARILVPMLLSLVAVGVLAGILAAWPTITTPPSQIAQSSGTKQIRDSWLGSLESRLRPQLLDWRAIIPATTTLTVFAVIVLLSGSLLGVLAPLTTASSGTVTEPGAPYPMASRIESQYATELRDQGLNASPEVIVAQVANGKPYLARGANYTAFAAVSDATLIKGHPPRSKAEAVIGHDLAQTLGIEVGESITLGGSTSPAVTRVTIVGIYRAPGVLDDQLIFPLATAHDLSTKPGVVHFIRTSGGNPDLQKGQATGAGTQQVITSGVSAPNETIVGEPTPISITLQNIGFQTQTRQVTATLGSATQQRSVTLQPGEETTIRMNLSVNTAGKYTLHAGSYSQPIQVYQQSPLVLPLVPQQAPPGSTVAIPVQTVTGTNVSGATLQIGDTATQTNDRGIALVTLPETPGTYNLTARKGSRSNTTQILITPNASRQLFADVKVIPQKASVYTQPEAKVTVINPWGTKLTRNLSLVTPAQTTTRTVTLQPYNMSTMPVTLGKTDSTDRLAPGDYSVRVVSEGQTLATDSYVILGDDRIGSTLAQDTQYSAGSGIGQAVMRIFGNFKLLLAGMIILAGVTTIGSTTATFAQVVHARRRAVGIHRATGASRWQVLRLLLSDVCRLSIPATIAALLCAFAIVSGMAITGMLTIFGIQLSVTTSLFVIASTGIGALFLSCISAMLAALPFLTTEPTKLQSESDVKAPIHNTSVDDSEGQYPKVERDNDEKAEESTDLQQNKPSTSD